MNNKTKMQRLIDEIITEFQYQQINPPLFKTGSKQEIYTKIEFFICNIIPFYEFIGTSCEKIKSSLPLMISMLESGLAFKYKEDDKENSEILEHIQKNIIICQKSLKQLKGNHE